jgi:hypothetical protein
VAERVAWAVPAQAQALARNVYRQEGRYRSASSQRQERV